MPFIPPMSYGADANSALVRPARNALAQKARITLGLSGLGSIGGAVAGGISAVVVAAVIDGTLKSLFSLSLFWTGAMTGLPLGAVLLPIAGWTLLRRVSFRRTIAGTVLGTMLGGLAGWFIIMDTNAFSRAIIGGVVGFFAAAIAMRVRSAAPPDADRPIRNAQAQTTPTDVH